MKKCWVLYFQKTEGFFSECGSEYEDLREQDLYY